MASFSSSNIPFLQTIDLNEGIPDDYSKFFLKSGYFAGMLDQLDQFLTLLLLYERIHDFGGGRPRQEHRDIIAESNNRLKEFFLEGPLLFNKKIFFTFTTGKVEDFFGLLIEEHVLNDRIIGGSFKCNVIGPGFVAGGTECEIVTLDDDDETKLSSDDGRLEIANFIYKFFEVQGTVNLICDAVGGSNSLLGKVLSHHDKFIYLKTIATLFDSAGTVDKLFINLDDKDNTRNKFHDTKEIKIHLQNFGIPEYTQSQDTYIQKEENVDNFEHKKANGELINHKKSPYTEAVQNIKQGPSVAYLACEVNNVSNRSTICEELKANSVTYEFTGEMRNILAGFEKKEHRKSFLFELKRNGDHLQVLITHYLNRTKESYNIFCSIDRLAIHFARLLRIPCILVNSGAGFLKLYKGMEDSQRDRKLTGLEKAILELKALEKKKRESGRKTKNVRC